VSQRARDRSLAALCAVLQLIEVQPGSGHDPSNWAAALGSVIGVAAGLSVAWRRTAPLYVLAAVTVGYALQAGLVGPIAPVAVLAGGYAAARFGPQPLGTLAGCAAGAAVAGVAAAAGDAEIALVYLVGVVVALLAGALVAARTARRTSLMREAVAEERLRIARDLHDIVGHGMGAITVQAGAGRVALDAHEVELARGALRSIEEASRDVLREVRWLVGLLRDQPERPGLDDLADLASAARLAGLTVGLRVRVAPAQVAAPVAEAAYRIVQEALTNVVRHAPGARTVDITVDIEVDGPLRVRVHDDGPPADYRPGGHGVEGMRERAASVGGELVAGPADDGSGWSVTATLQAAGPTAGPTTGRPR